jgi:hypothetical protein
MDMPFAGAASRRVAAQARITPEAHALPARTHNLPVATTLPTAVPAIAAAGYAGILAAFWLSFAANAEAGLSIAIGIVYAAVYFGVPYVLVRTADRHAPPSRPKSLSDFTHGRFDTNSGQISGTAALVQIVLIPVSLALCAVAIGVIYALNL